MVISLPLIAVYRNKKLLMEKSHEGPSLGGNIEIDMYLSNIKHGM
jgi:hypothetical protein